MASGFFRRYFATTPLSDRNGGRYCPGERPDYLKSPGRFVYAPRVSAPESGRERILH
jgi:hypothetical protein